MHSPDKTSNDEQESTDLLDCYRIALDFGMPAAIKAYEKLTTEPLVLNNANSIVELEEELN